MPLKLHNESDMFFFEGGERSKTLHRIAHYARHNPGIIVLTGPTGCGRSLVLKKLRQLFQSEESDFCLFGEDCMVLETEEELYSALAKGFGLEDKALEILEDLAERVQHFIMVSLQARRHVLIAVDDAQQHSADILGALLQLASSNKGLSVILTGENTLLEALNGFHLESLLIHQVALRPLLAEEIQEFVSQQSIRDGSQELSRLDQDELEELMGRTGGNMSLLVKETRQKMPSKKKSGFGSSFHFPMPHLVAMMCVIALTAVAFFYYPDDQADKDIAVPAIARSIPVRISTPALETSTVSAAKTVAKEQITPAPDLPTDQTEAEHLVGPEIIDSQNNSSKIATYSHQEQELLGMPSEHITLQIFSLALEKTVADFVAQQSTDDQALLRYYRRGTGDKTSYVLVYGEYPDKQSASAAAKALPIALKKGSPWPRPLLDVQYDIEHRDE